MKRHKTKRSEYTYMDIIRNLMWYRWDYGLGEESIADKEYYRLYHIANAKFYKKHFHKN